MVLAEAMAAGLRIVASDSGAIREVAGESAEYFAPGDWVGLARVLADVVSRPPTRVEHPQRYSASGAAERLAAAYDRVIPAS
jgi:glycosyltransferase involved in cell wall biosynthesis